MQRKANKEGCPTRPTGTEDRLLTQAETMQMLRLSRATLEKMRHKGTGPAAVKIGRSVRYRYSDVQRFISGLSGEGE